MLTRDWGAGQGEMGRCQSMVEAFSYKMNMLWRSNVEMLITVNNTEYTWYLLRVDLMFSSPKRRQKVTLCSEEYIN